MGESTEIGRWARALVAGVALTALVLGIAVAVHAIAGRAILWDRVLPVAAAGVAGLAVIHRYA